MKAKSAIFSVIALAAAAGAAAYASGHLPIPAKFKAPEAKKEEAAPRNFAIAVSVTRVEPANFVETALVTGSLVPREEVLVGPEIEGLKVLEVLVEEGARVKKGQVLARLVSDTLEAQVAQNDAALARTSAAIAQARSNIEQANARLAEAKNAYQRAQPLKQSGYLSESVFDQRQAAARTAEAMLVAARDGLKLAEAERAQVEAQRRELMWRRSKTEVTATEGGIVSRRNARMGSMAAMAAQEPMFRIIANGEIELDGEVPETLVPRIEIGQPVHVKTAGVDQIEGKVRLVPAEIDKSTRLGRVRILLGDNPALKIGAFARGEIVIGRGRGLAVPRSAILYGGDGPSVQTVENDVVVTRRIKTGLDDGVLVEVREGLKEGALVVTKSGTFLREGDAVRPMLADKATASGG